MSIDIIKSRSTVDQVVHASRSICNLKIQPATKIITSSYAATVRGIVDTKPGLRMITKARFNELLNGCSGQRLVQSDVVEVGDPLAESNNHIILSNLRIPGALSACRR